MEKRIYLIIIFLCVSFLSMGQLIKTRGALAYPEYQKVKQSNGEIIKLVKRGDRVVHWWETEEGEKVFNVDNDFVFAKLDSEGNMVPSDKMVEKKPSFIRRLFGAKQAKGEKKIFYSNKQIDDKKYKYFSTPEIPKINIQSRPNKTAYPSSGNLKMLMILVEFSDLKFIKEQQAFDDMMNMQDYKHPDSSVAYGSFRDYYLDASFGKLDIETTVTVIVTLPNDYAYYGENNSNGYDSRMQDFVKDALVAAENAGVDFSQFDNDNDGVVDVLNFIHAGEGEEASDDTNTIWSHSHALFDSSVTYDGVTFYNYVVNPEVVDRGYLSLTGIGVICHEFGHALGLPDFYDTDYSGSGGNAESLRDWCLMSNGSWNNGGLNPSMINAFSRQRLGWIDIPVLNTAGSYTLKESVSFPNQAFRINTDLSNEFFIVENRQQVSHDKHLPGHGMLMYHVDYNQDKWDSNTINIRPGEEGMKIVHAANVSDSAFPFPGIGNRTIITNTTDPNLKSNDGSDSPYSIINIVENRKIISFDFIVNNNYDLTFVVSSDGMPLSGIMIELRSITQGLNVQKNLITNQSGIVIFNDLPLGVYEYTINSENFEGVTNTVSLDSDKQIPIKLVPIVENNILSFNITDGEIPIEGASVSLSSTSGGEIPLKVSSADGGVEFEGLPYDEYAYEINKEGFITVNGIVNFTQSTVINAVMIKENVESYSLTVIVRDNNKQISGAVITLYSGSLELSSLQTNDEGEAIFSELPSSQYGYKIEKDGYNVYEGILLLSSDVTEDVSLDPLKIITLYVNDEGIPVSNMRIVVEKDDNTYMVEKITDSEGKVVLNDLYNGEYSFTTQHELFEPYEGDFSVMENGDESFTFNPKPYTYTLEIVTRDNSQLINGATVTIYKDNIELFSLETDIAGQASFTNLRPSEYVYKIEKDGYNFYEGIVFLSSDKKEEVYLDPLKSITIYAITEKVNGVTNGGMPIPSMNIIVVKKNDDYTEERTTGEKGEIVLNDLYNGEYSFIAEHNSFKRYNGEFTIEKAGVDNITFNPEPYSIKELDNKVNIYPNPTTDIVNIEIYTPDSILRLYDSAGHIIYENKYAGMINTINLGGYAPGVYNIVIINGENVFKRRVILK